jgi:hypothetical protein
VAIATLGSTPELGLRPLRFLRAPTEGRGRGRAAGELNGGVATAREVVEGRLTGGRTSAREDDGEGTLRAKRGSVGGVGGFTEGGSAFIGRRQGGGGPSAFNGRIEGVSMVGLKALVFRIEEGGNGTD